MAEVKYNNYKKPTPIKKGETVVYELAGLKTDPLDPEKGLAVPAVFGIPGTDRVFDKDKDEYIDIAHITGHGEGGKPIIEPVMFVSSMAGILVLNGGKAKDQAIYEYMEKSNYNGSNPDRDTSKPIYFYRKDYKAEAKQKREKRNEMIEAINKARALDVAHMRQVALGVGFTALTDDNDSLREKLEDYAEKNPQKFLAIVENKDLAIMEVANEAQKKGKLVIDEASGKITTANGEVLIAWGDEPDVNPLEKFVSYVKSDEGSKFYAELKEGLKAKKK